MVYEESFVVDSVRVEMENGMRFTRERDYDRRQAENSQVFSRMVGFRSIISYDTLIYSLMLLSLSQTWLEEVQKS